ncbi:TIGR02444 family protein [Neorhizobium petrolearium]|uniref:TIGR02444 family protein n=1 Tax=Neorhizobium petrolearium TaxID=515361 RepID=UPI003F17D9F2
MTADGREGLWDFALHLYAAPDVADACLVLQDESGVDVPVLLFSAWLAKRHSVTLTEGELARIDGLVGDWRNEVVKPLRAIRRRLKNGPYPAPTKETEGLRNGVKGAELNSEKVELAVLEIEGEALIATGPGSGDAGENLLRVLRYFRGSEPDARASEALAVVERALATLRP